MPQTFIQRSRSVPPSEKATFAVFSSKKPRDFFGLTPREEDEIERELDRRLDVNLNRAG